MADQRDLIQLIVPFANSKKANRQIDLEFLAEKRVKNWGPSCSSELGHAVFVELESRGLFCSEREVSFIFRTLQDAYPLQPCFVYVRGNWPTLHDIPNKKLDSVQDVQLHYGATEKHNGGSKDTIWWEYLLDIHNFIMRLQDCELPCGRELTAILRSQMHDLSDIVYVPSYHFSINSTKAVVLKPRGRSVYMDEECVTFHLCEDKVSDILRNWFGKRFLASVVQVDEGQWVSIIFDRRQDAVMGKEAHLYIFDPDTAGRTKRAVWVVQMWRQLLRIMGYPFHFTAISIPLSHQEKKWTGGYIALFSLLQTLRGVVGDTITEIYPTGWHRLRMEDGHRSHNHRDKLFKTPRQKRGDSELRFRDWRACIGNLADEDDLCVAQAWVLSHLTGCAAMELGIKSHKCFSASTPLRRIEFDLEWLSSGDWLTLDANKQTTVFGGFLPIIPLFAKYTKIGCLRDGLGLGRTLRGPFGSGNKIVSPIYIRPSTNAPQASYKECNPNSILPERIKKIRKRKRDDFEAETLVRNKEQKRIRDCLDVAGLKVETLYATSYFILKDK